jgi:hypothetical protein
MDIDQEMKKRVEEDDDKFFSSIERKCSEEIVEENQPVKDNWPTVVNVGMDPDVTAEVREGHQE